MEAPIAPAAMRRHEEGPTYDLISLGLVTLTLLVVGIWCRHLFHDRADEGLAGVQRALWKRENPGAGMAPKDVELSTAASHLDAAKWADFHMAGPEVERIPEAFLQHLKLALDYEKDERADLRKTMDLANDPLDRESSLNRAEAAAAALAADGDGQAISYAREWYAGRTSWADDRDAQLAAEGRGPDLRTREFLIQALAETGLREQLLAEVEKDRGIIARVDAEGFNFTMHAEFANLLQQVGLADAELAERLLIQRRTGKTDEEIRRAVEIHRVERN